MEGRISGVSSRVRGDEPVARSEFQYARMGSQPDMQNQHVFQGNYWMNHCRRVPRGGLAKEGAWGPKVGENGLGGAAKDNRLGKGFKRCKRRRVK